MSKPILKHFHDAIWELDAWMQHFVRLTRESYGTDLEEMWAAQAKACEKARDLLVESIGGEGQLFHDGRF